MQGERSEESQGERSVEKEEEKETRILFGQGTTGGELGHGVGRRKMEWCTVDGRMWKGKGWRRTMMGGPQDRVDVDYDGKQQMDEEIGRADEREEWLAEQWEATRRQDLFNEAKKRRGGRHGRMTGSEMVETGNGRAIRGGIPAYMNATCRRKISHMVKQLSEGR